MQLEARDETKAKEVQQEYQRPVEISDNVTHVEWYPLERLLSNFLLEETERKNQHPRNWGSKTSRNTRGAYGYNNLQNNLHYVGSTGPQEKNLSVICQSSVSIKWLL